MFFGDFHDYTDHFSVSASLRTCGITMLSLSEKSFKLPRPQSPSKGNRRKEGKGEQKMKTGSKGTRGIKEQKRNVTPR